jgi:hypothetical protein
VSPPRRRRGRQQGVDGLLRPDHVVFGVGLSHSDEFPEQVGPAGERGQHPGGVHALLSDPDLDQLPEQKNKVA